MSGTVQRTGTMFRMGSGWPNGNSEVVETYYDLEIFSTGKGWYFPKQRYNNLKKVKAIWNKQIERKIKLDDKQNQQEQRKNR